jgi:hypothetical protein
MSSRTSCLGLVALATIACSADHSDSQTPEVGSADSPADPVSETAARRRTRWPAPAPAPATTGGTVVNRQTADGEIIQVIIPDPAPTREVPAGGACGVVDAQGVLLSCAPGTVCISPAAGVPGTCQAGPRAPINQG